MTKRCITWQWADDPEISHIVESPLTWFTLDDVMLALRSRATREGKTFAVEPTIAECGK